MPDPAPRSGLHVAVTVRFTAEEFQAVCDEAERAGAGLVTGWLHDLAVASAASATSRTDQEQA